MFVKQTKMVHASTVKLDENAVKLNSLKVPIKKTVSFDKPRPVLGELGNRAKNSNIDVKKPQTNDFKANLKTVKPRVDTYWKKTDATKRVTRKDLAKSTNEIKQSSTATQPLSKLLNGKSSQIKLEIAENVHISSKVQITKTKCTENTNENVFTHFRRQESILTRKSLNKLRAATKNEEGKSENSDVIVSDNLGHSTILINDVDNIDINDKISPVLLSEYVNDIYAYLLSLELAYPIKAEYMKTQVEINPKMRAVLIDWISEVHLQFHLIQETFHMTVSIIDRYLQVVKTTSRKNLQLVGVSALLIASKYEELYPPEIKDIVYITDDTYNKQQILEMEKHILKKLQFQLGKPLPIHFLRRYSKAANSKNIIHLMAKYFIELTAVEYSMVHYRPSEIAAASLFLSIKLFSKKIDFWTPTLQFYTTYSISNLKPIIGKLAEIVRNAPQAKFKAIFEKYKLGKYEQISIRPELNGPLMVEACQM